MIYARELDAGKLSVGEARGEVELFRADQHMATDRLLYDPVEQVVTVPGRVTYADQQVWFSGEQANYSFLSESGRFVMIDYGLTGSSANGSAELAEVVGGNRSILHRVDYSTCPGEKPDWQISARELELRHDEGFGSARGAKLTFKRVPVLYAPWFSFPIDDRRKSGFLYPSLGHNSDSGLEIGVPWYWNIAPNQDATIEPRYFSSRGFMLSGDYRLLTRRTKGLVEYDYMRRDDKTEEERYYYLLRHQARPRPRWATDISVERVSDDRYFQDFGTSLGQTARQFLRSSGELTGVGRYWSFLMAVDEFQVIDESVPIENEPYRRLPRIMYLVDRPIGDVGLVMRLDSELVYFDRDASITGARFDLLPRLSWALQRNWGFFEPAVGYRFTGYNLDLGDAPGDDQPSTGTPIVSIDSGLVFDRHLANGDLQTLEPRLFYLYVPYEEQADQPLFDTGEMTFGFSQLFNTNRFAGGDRQSDANQLSLAVSTRRFDGPSGKVLWSLSLGQIVYFDEQKVQLGEDIAVRDDYSPFLAEFAWRPFSQVSATAGMQWDWERDQLDLLSLGTRYQGERGQRLSFEYRFRRDRVDQFDVRLFWPVNERWRLISRVNYSFDGNEMLEFQGGVEYESCCWALRTVIRRYLRNRDGDYRNSIYIQLNLKGLATIGSSGRELFRN